MNRVLAYIFRFIIIALGFLLAIAAATLFLFAMLWAGVINEGLAGDEMMKVAFVLAFPLAIATAGHHALFPFIAFAIAAEITSWRSWLTHMLGGMAVALVVFALNFEKTEPGSGFFALALAAGAVGGTVYWLVSGRNAGRHLQSPATVPSSKS